MSKEDYFDSFWYWLDISQYKAIFEVLGNIFYIPWFLKIFPILHKLLYILGIRRFVLICFALFQEVMQLSHVTDTY